MSAADHNAVDQPALGSAFRGDRGSILNRGSERSGKQVVPVFWQCHGLGHWIDPPVKGKKARASAVSQFGV